MTREQWLAQRGSFIGASEIAAIIGVSPFMNIGEIWLSKVQAQERIAVDDSALDPETESRFLRWGRRMERVIIDEYEDVTGFEVRRPGLQIWRHPEYPFIAATLDAEATTNFGDLRTVEAKNVDAFYQWREKAWGDEGTDEVPQHYICQGVQQMLVREHLGYATQCDYPVLFGGNQFKIYTVSYDRELAAQIVEIAGWFWGLVTRREAPPMDFSAAGATKLQRRIHDKIIGETLVVTEEAQRKRILQLVALRDYAHEQGKYWTGDDGSGGVKGAATAELMSIVGDKARLEIPIEGQKRPFAINRKPKAGYPVASFEVPPTVTMTFEPYHLAKRKELFNAIEIEVPHEVENEEQKAIEGGDSPASVGD